MRVNIIGGGLAGCALAYVLKQEGAEPMIYEASDTLASGASGNDIGLYNPRFSAHMDAHASYYSDAFFNVLRVFEQFGDAIDWTPCGVLTPMIDERKIIRLHKTARSWGWSEDDMRLVNPDEASEIAGVEIPYESLYLPKSGYVSPKKLCHEYAQGIEVHLETKVEDLDALEEGVTVLACGMGCLNFEDAAVLPLKAVRGQVSYIGQSEKSEKLKAALSYSGHITPARDGVHCLGSTFQPWLNHSELIPGDDSENLAKLFDVLPYFKGEYQVKNSRAGVRTTSKDHFPVVGQLDENVYISTAHGSYGILSTLLSAKILAKNIIELQDISPINVVDALSPQRFE